MSALKILATGIQNLTDARFFAAWDINWLVFNLDVASDTYLPPVQAAAIREWVEGPAIAGAFGLQPVAEIRQRCQELQLDAIVAGMATSLETIQELGQMLPVLKEIVVEPFADPSDIMDQLEQFAPWTDVFILNFQKNGLEWIDILEERPLSVDWLRTCCVTFPVLLHLDVSPGEILTIADAVHPLGFCVQGGAEEKTGFKSFDNLDGILEQLRD